jgi:hypothetical protein
LPRIPGDIQDELDKQVNIAKKTEFLSNKCWSGDKDVQAPPVGILYRMGLQLRARRDHGYALDGELAPAWLAVAVL